MKLGIAIRCFDRPKYLYVTLSSLFRQSETKNCVVNLYIDGGITLTTRQELFTYLGDFPLSKVCISNTWRGITGSYMYALSDMYNVEKCDAVLLLEEDIITRIDTLKYALSLDMQATIYALCLPDISSKDSWIQQFNPYGFVISKGSFDYFKRWMDAKLYLAHVWHEDKEHFVGRLWEFDFQYDPYIFDTFMRTFLIVHGGVCKFPDKSYTAHFGITEPQSHNNQGCIDIADKMFSNNKFKIKI